MKSTHQTLTANTVASVSLAQTEGDFVLVHLRSGSGPVYFTVDGSTPTVGGANTWVVHSNFPVRSVPVQHSNAQEVKLISATADAISVEAID